MQVTVEELAPVARFSLRVRDKGVAAVGKALGLTLPGRIGERADRGDLAVLCLGPDEWLLTAPEEARAGIVADLAGIYARAPHSLTDISHREVGFRISGPAAATLLSMGCPRDLDRLAPGRGVRTLFDSASVILWRDGPDMFRMDVWRSFAPHVRSLLEIGQQELAAGL
ncbi:sarcosine oxidase subunit gamma [Rhodovulum strictum]|uniref:Sarcosine oxidase subunit gamma n=1 Tax=Rhodovulum strictum TaxID=58314 RepID=A0A844B2X3_9RHOB|nr:sarcosine oxidase subunit gamma family protein [Rhodovulum strictum]MRH20726.1 sarcosine oxidase subunit gamma [Rhodovulum strictum]